MPILDVENSAVDRIRLAIVDYNLPYVLPDSIIEYYLGANNNNESATIRQCAGFILGSLAPNTRTSLDRITVYGEQAYTNYKNYLTSVINNATMSTNGFGGVYVGGVELSDVLANNSDATLVQRRLPIGYEQEGEYAIYEQPSGF